MLGHMIKLKGLNNRQIAFYRLQVNFLEEYEIDGRLVTNIHMSNGKWLTANHSLEEVHASLGHKETQDDEDQLNKWRKLAEWKRKAKLDAEAAIRASCLDLGTYKIGQHTITENADGSRLIKVLVEPLNAEG
jgi:hypothetical protein